MPDISLTIDFLRQKYYYINQLKDICLNVLMGLCIMEIRKKIYFNSKS